MEISFNTNREDFRWAALLAALETVADASLKGASQKSPEVGLSPVGGSLYLGQAYILQKAVMKNNLGIVNAYWNALTTVLNIGVGMAYGEKYTQTQILGCGLIAAGILII
jgi:multidrug transporter EmrE-like cation transporter